MRKVLPYLLLVILLLAAGFFIMMKNNGADKLAKKGLADKGVLVDQLPKSDDEKKSGSKDDLIKISEPMAGATIASPLIIRGEARGSWFFEASFPVQLVDANNKIVTTTIAKAQSDWMTNDFVTFVAELNFNPGPNKNGKLIFKKDNPSGQAILDDQLVLPVIY